MDQSYNSLRRPMISILVTLLTVFIGFQVVGPFIGSLIAFPFFDGDAIAFGKAFNNPEDFSSIKIPVLIMQGFSAIFGLILIPIFLLRKQQRSWHNVTAPDTWHIQPALLVPIIVIVFMGVNSVFISWNADVNLPDAFGIEQWARTMEDKLEELTKSITNFENTGELILAFVVIVIIPAIGEELVFRGMIQNDFYRATRNYHVAIWVSAFIFSAIHFQFYGFVPRLLLGALFGYLYYWSGNLWMPILAHFVNNGFTLMAMHLHRTGTITVDLENPQAAPFEAVIICTIFSILLLYAYKTFYAKHGRSEITD